MPDLEPGSYFSEAIAQLNEISTVIAALATVAIVGSWGETAETLREKKDR
jgi:hypothetical protein